MKRTKDSHYSLKYPFPFIAPMSTPCSSHQSNHIEPSDVHPTRKEKKQQLDLLRQELTSTQIEMVALQDQLQLLTTTFQKDAMDLISMLQRMPTQQSTDPNATQDFASTNAQSKNGS